MEIHLGAVYPTARGGPELRVIPWAADPVSLNPPRFAVQSRLPGGADWACVVPACSLEEADSYLVRAVAEREREP